MTKVKLKFFVVGSPKETSYKQVSGVFKSNTNWRDGESVDLQSVDVYLEAYESCCYLLAEWMLREGYEIHVAVALKGHADYYILKYAAEWYKTNRCDDSKIDLYLHTAKNDDTEQHIIKNGETDEIRFVKKSGYYKRHNYTDSWQVVHEKIIDEVDAVILIGGGTHSPEIAAQALTKNKMVFNLSRHMNINEKYGYDVVNTFLAPYYKNIYDLDEELVDFLSNEKISSCEDAKRFSGLVETAFNKYAQVVKRSEIIRKRTVYAVILLLIVLMGTWLFWDYKEEKIFLIFYTITGGVLGAILRTIMDRKNYEYTISYKQFMVPVMQTINNSLAISVTAIFFADWIVGILLSVIVMDDPGVKLQAYSCVKNEFLKQMIMPVSIASFFFAINENSMRWFVKNKSILK